MRKKKLAMTNNDNEWIPKIAVVIRTVLLRQIYSFETHIELNTKNQMPLWKNFDKNK